MYKVLLIISFMNYNQCFSQEKNINFIIVIDGNVNPNISHIKLELFLNNNTHEKYNLNYSPGNLEFDEYQNFKKNENIESIVFSFTYSEICGDNIKSYNYDIDNFKLGWLNNSYFILYIYNTDKKKYKYIYNPLPNKMFTYEYDYPGGSMKRVQKKFTKEQKKCIKN